SPGQSPTQAGDQANITLPPGVTLPPGLAERLGGITGDPKKFEDFDAVVKGAKEHDGLFKLYQKDDHVYAEIRQDQFDRPLLAPIAIARGMGQGGHTLNFDEQWVLAFRKVGDRVHVIRRNVHFTARPGTPAAKAVETTYTDSVLLALPIKALNPMRMSVLIDLNQIFMTDFANLGIGMLDPSRSTWAKVKAYPKNIELQVAATFSGFGGRGRMMMGNDAVIDPRGTTVVIHYGLVQLPEHGYQTRVADDRVGHFVTVVRDYSNDSKDTSFVRYVNRWRLERADGFPPTKLAPPKKKIVFWIEKSVPEEYRAYVRDGILEWNKAFEKIGFRDAIEVRQQESEDFDPEDINYATFRWITTNGAFAMGPSRVNPMTGEILDADIIFDADLVRSWKQEAGLFNGKAALEEPASLVRATKQGDFLRDALSWNDRAGNPEAAGERLLDQYKAVRQGMCQCGACLKSQLGLAAMSLAALAPADPRASQAEKDKASEELVGQAIKYVTMHEVGHTLGLRHNFKSSTMLRADQLNDVALTRKQGLIGSVMDYAAVNLAPKGVKQGDYFTTTLGPYDYWAIEYAYKPLGGGFAGSMPAGLPAGLLGGAMLGGGGGDAELKKIASRAAEPGLAYATDEDLYGGSDPLVHAWDLGADPLQFAQDRTKLAENLFKDLADRIVDQGEGYQRARQAFGVLLKQYGDAAALSSYFVAGEMMHRDHRGDPNARDPFVPVPADKQRAALRFVQDQILTDAPFKFPPELLRKLAADRWVHWGNERVLA
ncbi:MAG TPA: zinc-dependent metalloprotease, partial [Gemmataceae bacterium]